MLKGASERSGRQARLRLACGYETNSVSKPPVLEPPGRAEHGTSPIAFAPPFRLPRKDHCLPGNRAPSASIHTPRRQPPPSPPHPHSVQNARAQVVTDQIQVKQIKRKDNDPQSRHKQTTYRIYNNKNNAVSYFYFPYFLTNHSKRRICIVRGQGESPLSR